MAPDVYAALARQIRRALEQDGKTDLPARVSDEFLMLMRTALVADRQSVVADDLKLATTARELIPRISATAHRLHERLRSQLVLDAPWALVALDSGLDLLSPLGKAMHEPTHTKTLGFLLDPAMPHGLGVRVLREFFRLMGRLIPGEDTFERLARDSLQGTDTLRRIRVTTEQVQELETGHARCDLWLELQDEHRSLIVVVENKVLAGEHGEQLRAYEEALWRRAKDRRRLNFEAKLIFLTPDGRLPDQDFDRRLWLPVSYTNLAACLAHASRDAPEPGRTFLNLYTTTILRSILGVQCEPTGIERMQQLNFLAELRNHGETS